MKLRWILVLALTAALLPVAGCRQAQPEKPGPPASQEPTLIPEPSAEESRSVRVYLVRDEKVGVAARTVSVPESTQALAKAAVTELLSGPTAEDETAGLGTAIPQSARLEDLRIENGVATVGFTRAFEAGGGSLSLQLRVAQVVYTLTQFDEIKLVAFEIDGKQVKALGGEGVVVDPAVDRADFEEVTPAILVEGPAPGESVTSPLKAFGTSNTFEATHQLQLLDAVGEVLAETFVTATSGTGTRGTWTQELEFFTEKPGPGTLRAFVLSAKDGSEQDIVEIPVQLGK